MTKRALTNRELFDRYRNDRKAWETDARQDLDFYLGNHFTQTESHELASETRQMFQWIEYHLLLKD